MPLVMKANRMWRGLGFRVLAGGMRRGGELMSKLLVAAVPVVLWAAVAVAGCATSGSVDRVAVTSNTAVGRPVDLNEAGALEALARSNPAHYAKIRQILDGILQQQDAGVPRWIQANFDGRNVTYAPVVLTSHPPKRRLSFALDGTRYDAIIVLTNVRGDVVPLR
jgi:hypothetical protein